VDNKVNLTELDLTELEETFPHLALMVFKAKGHYRCQCLLEMPYLQAIHKVIRANQVFILALAGAEWETDDTPPLSPVLRLVSALHTGYSYY